MEEHNEDDNSGYPDLVAGGKRLTVWHIFKDSTPPLPFSAIWASMSLQGQ